MIRLGIRGFFKKKKLEESMLAARSSLVGRYKQADRQTLV